MYTFVEKPVNRSDNKLIAEGTNGQAYFENGQLHIYNTTWHLIYNFESELTGWYVQNNDTLENVYLGEGAVPSIDLENLVVFDEEYWQSLLYDIDNL